MGSADNRYDGTDRRRFLSRVIGTIQAFIAAILGVVLGGAAVRPGGRAREEDWLPAASLAELSADEPVPVVLRVARQDGYSQVIDRRTVFLLRTGEEEVLAIDSTCTHLGCRVSWDAGAGELRCPCHGGAYDRTGEVVSGPPPARLATFSTRLEDGRVLVRL